MNESNLHNYQHAGAEHIIDNPFCALFLDMGLGKTVTTLTAFKKLMFEELEVSRALVIAPKRVAENVWPYECDKWDHLQDFRISKIVGNEAARKRALKQKADIYVIGRDNVVWLTNYFGGLQLPFDALIIDESSSFKSPKSLRFKALRRVQPTFDRVVLLTGTPAPNGLIDLWSQMYLLDRGQRLGKTFGAFKQAFFKPNQRNGHIVYNYKPVDGGEAEIHQRIGDIAMSMKAEDFLDMPEMIMNTVEVRLDDKARKGYEDFEREQVLELFGEGQEITAANGAALSNKLLQYANGAIYDENKNSHEVHDAKLDALEEIIENANGTPVLIAYAYKHDAARLSKRLKKYKPVKFNTKQNEIDWNAGKIPVMYMHPASGGHGINLQGGGNIIVWFGLNWSLELYQQFNARLYRQGQQSASVIIHHLLTVGTIDRDVMSSLSRKEAKQEGLLAAVKARVKRYASN